MIRVSIKLGASFTFTSFKVVGRVNPEPGFKTLVNAKPRMMAKVVVKK